MPMGIVSDEQFSSEINRVVGVSNNSDTEADTIPARIDSVSNLEDEVSDYEPKEKYLNLNIEARSDSDDSNTGLGLRELESSDGISKAEDEVHNPGARIHQIEKGRPIGRHNRTPEEREIIAGEALIHGNQYALSNHDVSQSSISAYKKGATSTASYDNPDNDLLNSVSNQRLKIASVAHGKLSAALDQITNEKLASANLKTIASVAQSMSAIVKNMEPDQQISANQNIQFTFYAPRSKSEESYDVIDMRNE